MDSHCINMYLRKGLEPLPLPGILCFERAPITHQPTSGSVYARVKAGYQWYCFLVKNIKLDHLQDDSRVDKLVLSVHFRFWSCVDQIPLFSQAGNLRYSTWTLNSDQFHQGGAS